MAILAPDNIANKRMAICRACPQLIQAQIFGVPLPGDKPQCGICLCFMKKKTKIASMKCPIDKWGKYPPKKP